MKLPWDRPVDEAHIGAHWFGRMLTALYFSTFMIRASFAIMLIAFPIYIIGLKSYFLFGLVLASSPLFELITVLGLGAYIDKHGRKNVLLLGLLSGALALFALLLTKAPVPLFVINAFHGMSAAAILVSSLALIADYAPPERRGRIMGVFDFTNLFGWIVGFGVGGLLIDVFEGDIGKTFVVAGVMALVAWVWALLNVVEPHKESHLANEVSFKTIAAVLKQRSVVLLIAPWFIIYLLVSTMLTFTSKAGTQELGLSGTDLAVLLGGGGTIFLITQVVYGQLSDRYGRTRIMIVGTVGIVGIMLTVGAVFLTAPAVIAPAGRTLLALNADGDAADEYLLQSDYGLYLVDDAGGVLEEFAPPEGGFGDVQPFESAGGGPLTVVGFNHEAIQVVSLERGEVTWVLAVHRPFAVHAADLNADGQPEILYADAAGLHVAGPAVPSAGFFLPPLAEGERVLDAAWGATQGSVYALIDTPAGNELRLAFNGTNTSGPVPAGLTRFVPSVGIPAPPALVGSSGALSFNSTSGAAERSFAFPEGWEAVWLPQQEVLASNFSLWRPVLVAFSPAGGTLLSFVGAGGSDPPIMIEGLPTGFVATAWTGAGGPNGSSVLAGFAANGSLLRVAVDLTGATAPATLQGGAVLVKREVANATFGKLTSPALLAPLGIFGLMAGAFGPAALAGLTDVAHADKRGTTMGLYSVVISTSMIVGPIATGYLVDNHGGFGVMMFLVLSAAAMAIFMALRAWDVRRAGGEHMLTEAFAAPAKAPEEKPAPPQPPAVEGAAQQPSADPPPRPPP